MRHHGGAGRWRPATGIVLLSLVLFSSSLAGCFEPEPEQLLHVAGVHHRWAADGGLVLTASLVNVGTQALPRSDVLPTVQARLDLHWLDFPQWPPEPRSRLQQGGFPGDYTFTWREEWPPGRHETVSVLFDPPPREENRQHYFHIDADALHPDAGLMDLTLRTACFDEHDAVYDPGPWTACGSSYGLEGVVRLAELSYWERAMLACCDWLPPPFDVYNLTCQATAGVPARVACDFEVWNWHDTRPENATAELRVYQTDPFGRETLVATGPATLTGTGPLAPREARAARGTVELPASFLANTSTELRVQAVAWPPPHQDRAANATATVNVSVAGWGGR